jgi:hypothetical protein
MGKQRIDSISWYKGLIFWPNSIEENHHSRLARSQNRQLLKPFTQPDGIAIIFFLESGLAPTGIPL